MKSCPRVLSPFQRQLLEKNLETEGRPELRRRIEIMLAADNGLSQSQICQTLNCSNETARYWIAIAQSGQAHLWNQKPMGRPQKVTDEYRDRLRELVSHSPRDYRYSFQRWTGQWLSRHLAKELGIRISARHVNALLKQMGLSTRQPPINSDRKRCEKISIQDLADHPQSPDLWISFNSRPSSTQERG